MKHNLIVSYETHGHTSTAIQEDIQTSDSTSDALARWCRRTEALAQPCHAASSKKHYGRLFFTVRYCRVVFQCLDSIHVVMRKGSSRDHFTSLRLFPPPESKALDWVKTGQVPSDTGPSVPACVPP